MSEETTTMAKDLEGAVCVFKRIRRHKVWHREPFTYGQAWVDLLLVAVDAASAPQEVWCRGERLTLSLGQVGRSIVNLAEEWKRSREWVMAFLKWCQNEGMITVKSDARGTIITIINYEAYQIHPTAEQSADLTTEPTAEQSADLTTEPTAEQSADPTHKGKGEMGNREKVKGKQENTPLPEIPDDAVLGKWFAEFKDLARGVEGIPEVWWRGWVSSRLNAQKWPVDWKTSARMAFLSDFENRLPKALAGLGGKNEKNAAARPEGRTGDGRTPAQARFEASRELEEVQARLDACHEASLEPDARDRTREKELEQILKGLDTN